MIRKIVQSGDPVLRKEAKEVRKIDKKILNLIQDLKDTLATQKDPEGVGLAAPQIGVSLRVFIADYKKFKKIVINPQIINIETKPKLKKQKTNREILEGCLSLPFYYGPLERANSLTIKYMNEKGEEIIEDFEDFNAQIVLHEIDHLNGILFIDRLLEAKKPLYQVKGNEWEEVELA